MKTFDSFLPTDDGFAAYEAVLGGLGLPKIPGIIPTPSRISDFVARIQIFLHSSKGVSEGEDQLEEC